MLVFCHLPLLRPFKKCGCFFFGHSLVNLYLIRNLKHINQSILLLDGISNGFNADYKILRIVSLYLYTL